MGKVFDGLSDDDFDLGDDDPDDDDFVHGDDDCDDLYLSFNNGI